MRGDYREAVRIDGDADAVDFAIPIFAVLVYFAAGGEDFVFTIIDNILSVSEIDIPADAVGAHRRGVEAVDVGAHLV